MPSRPSLLFSAAKRTSRAEFREQLSCFFSLFRMFSLTKSRQRAVSSWNVRL